MVYRMFAAAFGFAVALGSLFAMADDVEVAVESAEVKVGEKVVVAVKQGQRLRLLQTQGPWVAVSVGEGGARRRGWILANKIRRVVDPALETAAAPEAPAEIRMSAEWPQVRVSADRKTHYLFVQLALTNETIDPVKFAVTDLALRVDDLRLLGARPGVAHGAPRVGVDVAEQDNAFNRINAFNRMRDRMNRQWGVGRGPAPPAPAPGRGDGPAPGRAVDSRLPQGADPYSQVKFAQDMELAPDAKVEGWLCFDLAPLGEALKAPFGLSDKSWVLEGKIGEQTIAFDLKAHEIQRLDARLRPSKFDESVRVLELAPHVNALNAGKLIDVLDEASAGESRFVLLVASKEWFFEEFTGEQLSQRQLSRQRQQRTFRCVQVLPPGLPRRDLRSYIHGISTAESEEAATVQSLAFRAGAGAKLIKFLSADAPATRSDAARALSSNLDEDGVIESLIAAAVDPQASVRVAALGSLGGRNRLMPAEARQDQSAAVVAILKAMRDPDPSVRCAAALAARSSAWEPIQQELIARLDDDDIRVQAAACASLGDVKSRAAVGKLKELQAGNDKQLSASAISALERIGELTEIEAALARLDCGQPASQDFDRIAKAKELRAVPQLLALLKSPDYQSQYAAQSLGEMKVQEAFVPLLEMLQKQPNSQRPYFPSQSILALGKLGDPRAIEPLRAVLRQEAEISRRLFYYEALLTLKAPGVCDELVAELKQADQVNDVTTTLRLLALHGGESAIAIIEPYLDREANCRTAAGVLTLIPAPKGALAIESRLRSADYAFGPQLLEGLSSNRLWLQSPAGTALLKKAEASLNDATRAAAAELSESLERERRKE